MLHSQQFRQGFIESLNTVQELGPIAENGDLVDSLIEKLEQETLMNFAQTLEETYLIKTENVGLVAQELMNNEYCSRYLGNKIILLWLEFKIYKLLDIEEDAEQRQKVKEIFSSYKFEGSNFGNFYKKCCEATSKKYQAKTVQDMQNFNAEHLNIIFSKPPEQLELPVFNQCLDKGVQEQLAEFIDDFKVFPEDSLQKEVQREIILTFAAKRNLLENTKFKEELQGLGQSNIEALYAKYLSYKLPLPFELEETFKESKRPQGALKELQSLKSKIFSINVLQLQRLIAKTNFTRQIIKDKHVVFVIGNTGCGKTTIILKFLDYQLQLGKIDGLTTLRPKTPLLKAHQGFICSPEPKSCTKYINAAPFSDKMYPVGTIQKKKGIIICDTPGFQDTAGVEVDIANGIGMINALHEAQSVRIPVILPYESIIADRMAGVITMGTAISSLFHEMTTLESIAIFFNKVPENMIQEMPNLIAKKKATLSSIERDNQKLMVFIEEMETAAKDRINYLDPFTTKYIDVFQKVILKKKPIKAPRQTFRYDFTGQTKKKIDIFSKEQCSKVKDLFQVRKFKQCRFHLKMLESLNNILLDNDSVKKQYNNAVSYIQDQGKKSIKFFEDFLNEILNSRYSERLREKWEHSRLRIAQFERQFKNFDNLEVNISCKIDEIVKQQRNKLLHQFSNIKEITTEKIESVASFSSLFDKKIQSNVLIIIQQHFDKMYLEVQAKIKGNIFNRLRQDLNELSRLTRFSLQLTHNQPNQLSQNLELLKETIFNFVQKGQKYMKQNIIKEDSCLSSGMIEDANRYIELIEDIETLQFLDNTAQIRKQLENSFEEIESKCRKILRNLQDTNLTFEDDVVGNLKAKEDQLISQKQEIEHLMRLKSLREGVKEDYEYVKKKIIEKLQDNVKFLQQSVRDLRNSKNEDIFKSFQNIKKAAQIVQRYSQIFGQSKDQMILESIQKEFVSYISGTRSGFKMPSLLLNQLNNQTLRKIKEYYDKIQSYMKLRNIGTKVKQAVDKLHKDFLSKLKEPFNEFSGKYLHDINQKANYKLIIYSLNEFNNLCDYAKAIEDIIPYDDYEKVIENKESITKSINKLLATMNTEINDLFEQNQTHKKIPQKLKDIIKTLLSISQKSSVCEQLAKANQNPFDTSFKIYRIGIRLGQIKEQLEKQVRSLKDNLQGLQVIINACRFYCQIEDMYKIKGQPENKFGFHNLLAECQRFFAQREKQSEEYCKYLIQNCNPTQINFRAVGNYYELFKKLGGQRQTIIIQELRKLQQKILNDLQNCKKTLDNTDFINLPAIEIEEHLGIFNEAVELEKQLRKIYSQEDASNNIQIKKYMIEKIAFKIIDIFEKQFEMVFQFLQTYSLNAVPEKLKTFSNLQRVIIEFFNISKENIEVKEQNGMLLQANSQICFQQKGRQRLIGFIRNSRVSLSKMIEKFSFLKEKFNNFSLKSLANTLEIIYKELKAFIKIKFESIGEAFTIDGDFQMFYSHSSEQKKKELQSIIDQNLDILRKDYAYKYSTSRIEDTDEMQEKIKRIIGLLPVGLRFQHSKSFDQLKQTLIKSNDQTIVQLSSTIIKNPITIIKFFENANLARKNGQAKLHKKYINAFVQVYTSKQHKDLPLTQLIPFIENSFIGVYHKSKDYFVQDTEMLNEFIKKFGIWLDKLHRTGIDLIIFLQTVLGITHDHIQTPKFDMREIIANAFKVYSFVAGVKDCGVDFSQSCKKFFKSFDDNLIIIINAYKSLQQKQPQIKLNSKDIMQASKLKEVKNYIQNITFIGSVFDTIKQSLSKASGTCRFPMDQIRSYQEILFIYEKQVAEMVKFIKCFEFCTDSKRNFQQKQMEADLNRLKMYCIILQKNEEFFVKAIIQEKCNCYKFDKIANRLLGKFNEHLEETKKEIVEVFGAIDGGPTLRTNLLIQQLTFMSGKDQDFRFITNDQIMNSLSRVHLLLKEKFDESRKACKSAYESAKKKFLEYSAKWQIKNRSKQELIMKAIEKCKALIKNYQLDFEKAEANIQLQNATQQQIQKIKKKLAADFNSIKNEAESQRQREVQIIEGQFAEDVSRVAEELSEPVLNLCIEIIKLRKGLKQIFEVAEKYKPYLAAILDLLKTTPKLLKMVGKAMENIPNDHKSIGQMLLQQKVFISLANERRTKITEAQDIEYVVQHLQLINPQGKQKPDGQLIKRIIKKYSAFKKKYEEYKSMYQTSPTQSTIYRIVTQLKDYGLSEKKEFYMNHVGQIQKNRKVELLAGIFAVWSIINADKFEDGVEFTKDPHPAQVTTLILQLGMVDSGEILSNKLSQVGTGEGKSIVLAGLSCYLALLGFKVRCACYSAYLSGRDQESFKSLFERLGVSHKVRYGTFNEICQNILNGNGSDLKDSVHKMILQPPSSYIQRFLNLFGTNFTTLNRNRNEIDENSTILVIDEVDVFFDKNFFGNNYCPAISLRGPQVSNFLDHVWNKVQKYRDDIDPSLLIKSGKFKQLVDRYPTLKDLFKNQVHGMVACALQYKHEYVVSERRIVYKDNDSLSNKISHGYKTVFAYIHEYNQNRVNQSYAEEAKQISLMIAEFSYAALPNYFTHILGVTGTLEVLPEYLKENLSRQYNIVEQHAIPSAFGINNKRIQNYHIVKSKHCNNNKIIELIKNVQNSRPIIIFFKGADQLGKFFDFPQFEQFKRRTICLTEEHNAATRDYRIQKAVEPNTITLMSSAFGRGTDFIVRNPQLKKIGGLHIIQAFLSLDESEEVQIKGRTARQNEMGSYDCVIDENDLEQLGLRPGSIPSDASSASIHKKLKKARQAKVTALAQTTLEKVETANKQHKKALKEYGKKQLKQADLIDYIQEINRYPEIGKIRIKTVLGLDATGSMGEVLQRTCQIIDTTFERAYAVLKEKSVKANIEVKIMIYRNYNSSAEEIIDATPFQNTPIGLTNFLKQVQPLGGNGNEALEVLFQKLNKEEKLHQVIIIGDAAANSEQQTIQKRAFQGEDYWNQNRFPQTSFKKELKAFQHKKCPVHTFQVNTPYNNPGLFFKDLSSKTGGQYDRFNVNAFNATAKLTNFVVEQTLSIIQEQSGDDKLRLVETYRRMFLK